MSACLAGASGLLLSLFQPLDMLVPPKSRKEFSMIRRVRAWPLKTTAAGLTRASRAVSFQQTRREVSPDSRLALCIQCYTVSVDTRRFFPHELSFDRPSFFRAFSFETRQSTFVAIGRSKRLQRYHPPACVFVPLTLCSQKIHK
jgi:hypothetical protein